MYESVNVNPQRKIDVKMNTKLVNEKHTTINPANKHHRKTYLTQLQPIGSIEN